VVVQSMTCTDTRDVQATVGRSGQWRRPVVKIVRVAVPDMEAAAALADIRKQIRIPLIADIHFKSPSCSASHEKWSGRHPRQSRQHGCGKRSKTVIKAAKSRNVVIRIGINAGSLEKELLTKYGGPTPDALVESALKSIALFETMDFRNIKLSLKSSNVATMIEAYRAIADKTDYPLHLGVTEAGTPVNAAIKSAMGIGMLLYEGIGDTIRVSVTGSPGTGNRYCLWYPAGSEYPENRAGYYFLSHLRTL